MECHLAEGKSLRLCKRNWLGIDLVTTMHNMGSQCIVMVCWEHLAEPFIREFFNSHLIKLEWTMFPASYFCGTVDTRSLVPVVVANSKPSG